MSAIRFRCVGMSISAGSQVWIIMGRARSEEYLEKMSQNGIPGGV